MFEFNNLKRPSEDFDILHRFAAASLKAMAGT
jgi:hypothetical protein